MSGSWRPWYGYLIVILAEALLVGMLILVDPIVTMGRYPMVYIVLVMLAAYFLGEGPAILSLVLGWVAFTHLFLPPERFWPLATTPEGWAAQISYILGTFIVGFAAIVVRRSRQRIQQLVSELTDEIDERTSAQQEISRLASSLQLVLESTDQGIYALDLEGNCTLFNRAASEMTGWSPVEILGRNPHPLMHHTRADGSPYPMDDCPVFGVLRTGEGVRVEGDVFWNRDGTSFPVEFSTYPIFEDERIAGVVTAFSDVTERKRAETALREVERDLSRAQAVAQVGSWRLDARRNELVWSDEAYRVFGIEKGTPLTYEAFLDCVHPDDREYVDKKWSAAMKGEHYDIDHRICVGEHEKWVRETAEMEFDQQGVFLGGFGTAQDITDRKRAELALDEDRRRTAAVAGVAEAGISTLNTEELHDVLVNRIREGMHSAFSILFTYDGETEELVARATSNFAELADLRVPSEESFVGLIRKESRTVYVADASADPLVVSERIKQSGLRSLLGAPLAVGGRFLGVVCVGEADVREYSPEEIDLFESMVDRASLAVENAKLYSEVESSREELEQALEIESYFSRQLQRALLPPTPEIGKGYVVGHKYFPAYAEREIGGDFYDVFRTESGRVAIVMGDVSGKGLEAASMAAITRATVHAFAYEFSRAGDALTHANAVISAQQETGQVSFFVTVFLAILDPSTGETTYSSAGHPPPAIRHADTVDIEFLEVGHPPLGVIGRYEFGEGTCSLRPGDRIVFYTDGLSEARRGPDLFETDGIAGVLREHGAKSPDEIIGELTSAAMKWAAGHLRDDTAIVVIERE